MIKIISSTGMIEEKVIQSVLDNVSGYYNSTNQTSKRTKEVIKGGVRTTIQNNHLCKRMAPLYEILT